MFQVPITRRALLLGLAFVGAGHALAGEEIYRREDGSSVSSNVVRAVQSALAQRGIDPGPIDGIPGNQTAAAIRTFEESQGMRVTGWVSQPLLVALGLAAPPAVPASEGSSGN